MEKRMVREDATTSLYTVFSKMAALVAVVENIKDISPSSIHDFEDAYVFEGKTMKTLIRLLDDISQDVHFAASNLHQIINEGAIVAQSEEDWRAYINEIVSERKSRES
jgi:hypothetical protein